jgi:hypothetical protein
MYLIYFIIYICIKTILYEKKIAFKKSNILVESVKNYPDCVETWDINFWYPTHDLGLRVKGEKIGWIVWVCDKVLVENVKVADVTTWRTHVQ